MTTHRLTTQTAALTTLIGDRWPNGTEARLVADLAARLPRTIEQMAWSTPDGYPTSVIGADGRGGGGGGGSLDTLGNLVAARAAGADAYALMCELVARAAACVVDTDRHGVRRAISDALTVTDVWHAPLTPKQKENLMCATKHAEDVGTEPWVDPTCERVADVGRNGLCEACYRRRLRGLEKLQGASS